MIYICVGSPGSVKFVSSRRVSFFCRLVRFFKRIFFIRIYLGEKHLRSK